MATQYYTASSLDGFIATEDDSIAWLDALADVTLTSYPGFIANVGALAMGAATYRWMLRHVLKPVTGAAAPWPYTQPTWVFSSRALELIDGAEIHMVHGDVRPVHAAMMQAAAGRNIWIVGGGDLVGQFYDAGLLDEMIVQIGSVTLGRGKPLLPRRIDSAKALRLTSVERLGDGMAELRYHVSPPPAVEVTP
jgi:dihydrofolate reductase